MRVRIAVVVALFAPALATCNDNDTVAIDWLAHGRFSVTNHSSEDLTVAWSFQRDGQCRGPVAIATGNSETIHEYDSFDGPPPDAAREFRCVSVYRTRDDRLVHQLVPVRNDQWSRHKNNPYDIAFTLVLTNATLDSTIQNACARLSGTVVDSLTMALLDQVTVEVHENGVGDEPSGIAVMSPGSFGYGIEWAGELPSAEIQFSRDGFVTRAYRLPDDTTDLGDRHYELNALLVPAPSP